MDSRIQGSRSLPCSRAEILAVFLCHNLTGSLIRLQDLHDAVMTELQRIIQRNVSPPGHTESQLLDDELLGGSSKDDERKETGVCCSS